MSEFQVDDAPALVKPSEQVMYLRQRIKDIEGENRRLREQLGSQQEFADAVAGAIAAADPFPPFVSPKCKRSSDPVVAVVKFSDRHIGEVIQKNETEGFGEFNWAIAQARVHAVVGAFIKWVKVQRLAYRIDECVALCEGDYVSGDIHQELLVTNEFPLPVQTANAGLLLGDALRILAGNFKSVRVVMVGADNHGRLVRKPQAKQKTSNNMSYLVHALVIHRLERQKNIRFQVATGAKELIEINGFKFLCEHGDAVRGWAGYPYYGFGRLLGREARRRMNTQRGFHYWSIGHFHVPCVIERNTLVNGSLSGTSEFDHIQGRTSDPSQVAFLVVKQHGLFNWVPFGA